MIIRISPWVWACIILTCIPFQISSQSKLASSPQQIKKIGIAGGLSQATVTAIAKDKYGYIWIGTQDGLNRFDGENIITFKHFKGQNGGPCGNLISSLLYDGGDRLWIGTVNKGICFYNFKTGTFQNPSIKNQTKYPFDEAAISHITLDSKGTIWIATSNSGILKLIEEEGNFTLHQIFLPEGESASSIFISNNDKILLGSAKSQVFSGLITADKPSDFKQITQLNINGKINCFTEYGNSTWIGTDNGMWMWNSKNNTIERYPLNEVMQGLPGNYSVYHLDIIEGLLWLCSGNGLYRLGAVNQPPQKWKPKRYGEESTPSLSHNTVNAIYYNNSHLLVGTSSSLDIFDFKDPKFKLIDDKRILSLSSNIVFATLKIKNSLWVGTTRGLHLYEGDSLYIYREDDNNVHSISDDIIRDLLIDNDNNLWIATTFGVSVVDLDHFDPKKPVFQTIYSAEKDESSLSDNLTLDLFMDNHGLIWVATKNQGISIFTGNLKNRQISFQQIKHQPRHVYSISSNYVHHITQDSVGQIWIGTQKGLDKLIYNYENHQLIDVINIKNQNNDSTSLSENSVHQVFFDKTNTLWCATRFGLNKFNSKKQIFSSYHIDDGLPNEVIYSIEEDFEGNLWMGTNEGLVCLQTSIDSFRTFNIDDGTGNKEYNILSSFKDKKGNLYFGGMDGLTYFNPREVLAPSFSAKTLISQIIIPKERKNNTLSDTQEMSRLTLIPDILSLSFNAFPIYITLAIPELGPFERPDFYYRLRPLHSNWIHLQDRNEIQFLNLPKGDYFLDIANDYGGAIRWSKEESLRIQISPPWWKTIWAYLLYASLGLFLLSYVMFLISKRTRAQQEAKRVSELEETKSRFYANVTHEFRTPLTVIIGVINELNPLSTQIDPEDYKKKIDLVSRNAKQLLNLVNQLLDITKLNKGTYKLEYRHGNLTQFTKNLIKNLNPYAQNKGIQLVEYMEGEDIYMDYPASALEKVISNLIINAIKFSDSGTKVIVHMTKSIDQKNVIIKIKDEGIGISEDRLGKVFERFYQIEDDLNRQADGTGIGLSLVKEFVELMNSEISVHSKEGQGTEFKLIIPIVKSDHVVQKIEPELDYSFLSGNKASQEISTESLEVLIVEDNDDIATYISSCLGEKFTAQFARDGSEALSKVNEHLPDIIISDIMMPKMDGYELCTKLKNDPLTSHIPIILLTARTSTKDKIRGLNCGADAYLSKPFNKEELQIRVDHLTALREKLRKKYSDHNFWMRSHNQTNKDDVFMIQLRDFIHQNMEDANYRPIHLARDMSLSESQLYRKIKASSGKSTALFMRHIRLIQSKYLLETTSMTVSEVAYNTGFSDPSYFSRCFKQEFDIIPSQTR